MRHWSVIGLLAFGLAAPVQAGIVPVGQNRVSYKAASQPRETFVSSETLDVLADVSTSGSDGEVTIAGRAGAGGYLDTPPFAIIQGEVSARGRAEGTNFVRGSLQMEAQTQWFAQPVFTGTIPLDPDIVYEIPFIVEGFWEISVSLSGSASGRAAVTYPEFGGAGGTAFRQVQVTDTSPPSVPRSDGGRFKAPFTAICPGDIGCIARQIGISAEIDIGAQAFETLFGGSVSATALVDPIAYIDPAFAFADDWTVLISDNLLSVGPDVVFPDPPIDPDPPTQVPAPGSAAIMGLALGLLLVKRRRIAQQTH